MKIADSKILFLTLHTFSLVGGIEKVARALSKVLDDLNLYGAINYFKLFSMHDSHCDKKYLRQSNFEGFNGNKTWFAFKSLLNGMQVETIILSHINLLLFALLIKTFNTHARIIVYAHGIEVWRKLPTWKIRFLSNHCEIWAVSTYTQDQLVQQKIPITNIKILNNCLDPYFEVKRPMIKSEVLSKRYSLKDHQPILFTLARMSSIERYKGYDHVINSLKTVLIEFPNLKYILAGGADELERERVLRLIQLNELENHVILTGFVADEEITDHYHLSNIFIMPSQGEGFGISYIEAAACGIPSIAGNQDGSTDALLHGELGKLVDQDNHEELSNAIVNLLETCNSTEMSDTIRKKCLAHFSYECYKQKIIELLKLNSQDPSN